jgi:hypothetical protein
VPADRTEHDEPATPSSKEVGMLGWEAVEGLDWGRLLHAYGPASDTPSHPHALTGDDWEAQLKALDHLAYSVVHQYSVYPVKPFAVRVVAGLLDHSALRRTVDDKPPLLAEVLDFFDEVAYSVSAAGATATTELLWEEVETTPEDVAGYFEALANHDIDLPASPPLDQLWEWSIADLHAALAELVDVILPLSKDHDPTVRTRSICLLTRLAQRLVHRAAVASQRCFGDPAARPGLTEPGVHGHSSCGVGHRQECSAVVPGWRLGSTAIPRIPRC